MPSTVNNDVIIHNQLAQLSYLERVQDNLDIFNGASNNALRIESAAIKGDFKKDTFYRIGGAMAWRDVNSTATVTSSSIAMDEMVGVKSPFKYGPFETTLEAFKRRDISIDEFSTIVGHDYADAEMQHAFLLASSALTGAIGSNASMQVAGSLATDGIKVLTKTMRTMGDKFSNLKLWVMDAGTYLDIVDIEIEATYENSGVVIYGGSAATMGIPVLVTDQVAAGTVYALQDSAIILTASQAPEFRQRNVDDQENLGVSFRAEGVLNVDVLGYSYVETAGANPDAAILGAAASWRKHATSNKSTAGVILTLDTV